MATLQIPTTSQPFNVDLSMFVPQTKMNTEEFYQFCRLNPDLRIERLATGEIIVMPPAFSDTGNRNFKMDEYIENGVRLGLLVDRKHKTVHVYRPGRSPQLLENPETINCSPELPGLSLKMKRIW